MLQLPGRKGHLKQSRSVNFENFPFEPTMGAPTGVTIYVETQSLPKNGSHQKWPHEALNGSSSLWNMNFATFIHEYIYI